MTVISKKTRCLQAIFVNRTDILNGIRIETGYSLEIVKLL